jgi:hypothetical protein
MRLAESLRSILLASPGQPPTVRIPLVTHDGAFANVLTASRVFANWAPRPHPPCPPYQHWNKNYWIEHKGEPQFAETAVLELLTEQGWDARWVTWSSGRPTFRMAPKAEAKASLTPESASWFEAIWAEKQERENVLVNTGRDHKKLGGGCWDVFAWNDSTIAFIETKQLGEGWQDTIRLSQRLWLEAALACGLDADSFLILEWRLG